MTAEEFLVRDELFEEPLTNEEKDTYILQVITHNDYVQAMVEFARFHVQLALESAAENATLEFTDKYQDKIQVDADSILNAYPLEWIE